jgi:hypothetical protein
MSLEMAHKVILPPKKNYIPQFLKQRDINSYYYTLVEKYGVSSIMTADKLVCLYCVATARKTVWDLSGMT